jgi:hypothetical protein
MPRTASKALLFAVLSIAAAGAAARAATLNEHFEHTYPLAAGGTFALDNVNGDVAVEAWDRAEVRVTATKHVKAGTEAHARELLAALEIRVSPSPGEVRVETHYPSTANGLLSWLTGGGSTETSVAYRVDVPRSVKLRVATVNGSLVARGTAGGAHLKTVNGALQSVGVRGPLELASVNGAVSATGAAGAVEVTTTNGEIDVELVGFAPGETARLASTNGAVTLHLPRDARASLAARTVNGEIESAVPVTVHGKTGRRNHLEGDLNGGGGKIEISTTNGGIRIDQTGRV